MAFGKLPTLQGKRILIVEDEYFIAAGLRDTLQDMQADVVGPIGRLDEALAMADEAIDLALLDVNLGGAKVFPVADRLSERSVPYILVTGYDDWALPSGYRDAPRVTKPFADATVVDKVKQLLASGPVS